MPDSSTVSTIAVVGQGCGVVFLPGYVFDMCPETPHDPAVKSMDFYNHRHPFSRHIRMLVISEKLLQVIFTRSRKSPVIIPALLIIAETSSICLYRAKRAPILSSVISMGTPCTVNLVFRFPYIWYGNELFLPLIYFQSAA